MINNFRKKHLKKIHSSNGFSAVELLITLFVAAAFLTSGYQLYAIVIKDGGKAHAQASASNTVYDYVQRYKTVATNPCTAQTPLTNSSITASGLFKPTMTVAISCPYGTTSPVSKVLVTINYDDPKQTVTNAIFVNQSPSAPTEPTSLTASGGSGQVVLNWVAPANNGGSVVTGYRIYRGTTTNSEILLATVGNILTYTDTGLAGSTTYYYKITSLNKVGEGANSNEATATTTIAISLTFSYTGAVQTWVVPSGVSSIVIKAYGAQGGKGYGNSGTYIGQTGGLGGYATGTLNVTTGQTLYIYVGGAGADGAGSVISAGGFNGGGNGSASNGNISAYSGAGGGGASDVRLGVNALANRVIVGGGGGGGGSFTNAWGGYGGYPTGQDGSTTSTNGTGATQLTGGSANGLLGIGGAGVSGNCGAGGGGGYYGGGGSTGCTSGGAGGGSSYYGGMNSGTEFVANGVQSGNGLVIITN